MTPQTDHDIRRLALGVLLPGFSGTAAPPWLLEAAREGLAGVVLFAQNTPDVRTTRALTDSLHAAGPLLVMADEEGGDVSRLQATTGSTLPGAAAFGAADDLDLTRRGGQALGAMLAAAGIDVDLAPVLDVASEPRNPVIGVRSFGPDAAVVSGHGAAFVRGLHAGGVAACAKHYPGHGATTVDSHLALPTLDVSEETLRERDLPPFDVAAAAGLDSLMTGHLHIPAIGPEPGTLEPAVTALARQMPGGEDRAIITDAVDMAAVAGTDLATFGEACVRALEAGADLLCLGTTLNRDDEALFVRALDAVTTALREGRLDPALLVRAAERAEVLRERVRTHRAKAVEIDADSALAAVTGVGAEAARAAVRVAQGDPVGEGEPVLVDLRRRANMATGRTAPGFHKALRRRCPEAPIFTPGVPGSAPLAESLTSLSADARVIALTREPLADAGEQADLEAVLDAYPDAAVVHGGVADGAPAPGPGGVLVLAHGVGLANAEAALELLLS